MLICRQAAVWKHTELTSTPLKEINVKQISLIAAAATLVFGALAPVQEASATVICGFCAYTDTTLAGNLFIGGLSATTGDLSFVNSGTTLANFSGNFVQNFVFGFSPIGSITGSLSFSPQGDISNFTVQLFSVSGTLAANGCTTLNSACTSLGAAVAYSAQFTASPNNFLNIPFVAAPAGTYLARVTGTVTNSNTANAGYSGQISTLNVPEPGSLALAGLALFGAAAAMRRRNG